MKTMFRGARALLLVALATGAGACQTLDTPVLLLKVGQIPPCAGKLELAVTRGDRIYEKEFLRNEQNKYVAGGMVMPAMMDGPSSAELVIDLVAGDTVGTLAINVQAVGMAGGGMGGLLDLGLPGADMGAPEDTIYASATASVTIDRPVLHTVLIGLDELHDCPMPAGPPM